ncbi:MAG: DUF4124 domain-containing protein [Comamonadaceae bacterium]|nr:DUF4124 domain-containing protein [Comamonadaceae bacterium]
MRLGAALLLAALAAAASAGEIYHWKDKEGRANYADTPPPGNTPARTLSGRTAEIPAAAAAGKRPGRQVGRGLRRRRGRRAAQAPGASRRQTGPGRKGRRRRRREAQQLRACPQPTRRSGIGPACGALQRQGRAGVSRRCPARAGNRDRTQGG